MSILAKSWSVVTGTFLLQIAFVIKIHSSHASVPLSGLLVVISIVIAVAIGERAYRYFGSSRNGGA